MLCFTDADTVVPPTWVRDHCRHYSVATKSTVVGVGGPLEPLEPGLRHRVCFRLLSDWWYRLSWPLGFVQQPGPNCSVRRTAFERVGGFDESLPFLEDTDLSLRLRREGEVVYDRECAVRTSVRRQEREGYGRLFLTYARGYLAYLLPGRSPSATYFSAWLVLSRARNADVDRLDHRVEKRRPEPVPTATGIRSGSSPDTLDHYSRHSPLCSSLSSKVQNRSDERSIESHGSTLKRRSGSNGWPNSRPTTAQFPSTSSATSTDCHLPAARASTVNDFASADHRHSTLS
ncbi:hypothetical protein ACFQMM_07645 [Saliphagus sp. GCM10025308]